MKDSRLRRLLWALGLAAGLTLAGITVWHLGSLGAGDDERSTAVAIMGGGHGSMMRDMMQRMMGDILPPGIDPALLPEPRSAGAQLLKEFCTQCHHLPGPGMHTAAEWPQVINRMNRRVQMMGGRMMHGMMGFEVPTEAELKTLTEYLQKHAQRPIDTAKYADLSTPAGKLFSTTCSQCHALPDPKQHTAQEWPSVVLRMQTNMTAMGKPVPDEAKTKAIIGFLQQHGSEHQ